MPQSIKFLAIIFSILLVTITPNSFATEKEEALTTFSGKGKISESSHFPGLVVWSHINGEMGTFLIQTEEKLVSVRTQLSPSTNCEQDHTSLCFDGIVNEVRNSEAFKVGDRFKLGIDLANKKQFFSFLSGFFQNVNVLIDLKTTRTHDGGDFSLTFTREGGIAGIQRIVTIDSATEILTIKNGPDESKLLTLDDASILQLKAEIARSKFFDLPAKEYPPISGSADYFIYSLGITTKHFSNRIQWTDTSENIPQKALKKINSLQNKLENVVLNFLHENSDEVLPVKIAHDFIISSPTFAFDGIEQTLKAEVSAVIDESMPQYVINVIFDTRHGGYGDRTGQIVTEAITPHLATVIVSEGKVISVIIDRTWDEINQKLL